MSLVPRRPSLMPAWLGIASLAAAYSLLAPRPAAADAPPFGQWEELVTPAPRIDHIALYDSTRDRMLVFGGHPGDNWIFQFGAPGGWARFQAPAGGPSTFDGARAVWDTQRDRAIFVFLNGTNPNPPAAIWTLDFALSPHWTLLQATGTPPSFRIKESLTYDPLGDRLLIFAGGIINELGSSILNDLWELSLGSGTPAWHKIVPPGTQPSARVNHSAAIDVVRNRLVIFGGATGEQYGAQTFRDTWALPLDGVSPWSALPLLEWPDRTQHTATFDPMGNRMIVIGGAELSTPEAPFVAGGAYELSFGDPQDPNATPIWSAAVGGAAVDRFAHSAILRSATHEIVVFAGAREYYSSRTNELWALPLDGAPHWELRSPTTGPPEERVWQSAIYDPRRDRVVLYGGQNGETSCDPIYCPIQYFFDVWHLDLTGGSRWSERVVARSGRGNHSAILDPVRDRMVVFGGQDFSGGFPPFFLRNNVLALALDDAGNWDVTQPQGMLPAPRAGHSAIYDPLRDRMVVFGGGLAPFGNTPTNETWQLALAAPMTWSQLSPSGAPPPARVNHVAVYDPLRDRMLVLGGSQAQVWSLAFQPSLAWQTFPTVGTTPPLFGAEMAAVYDPIGDRILTFSGKTTLTVWSLDLSTSPGTWTQWAPSGPVPPPGGDYSAVYDSHGDRVIVFGVDGTNAANRTWALELGRAVPALAALVSAEVTSEGVHIVWSLGEAGARAIVEKRSDTSDWSTVGEILAGGSGLASFEDSEVRAGERYGYRISMLGKYAAEVWLEIPFREALAIFGARPNPSRHLALAFSLATNRAADLRVFDLRGRLVLRRSLSGMGAGSHVLPIPEADRLPSGVYVARVTQEGASAFKRVMILR